MFPNQPGQQPPYAPIPPQPNPQAPLDYLNQISYDPTPQRGGPKNFKMLFLIAGIVLLFIIVVSVIFTSIGNARKEPLERFAAQLTSSKPIAEDAQENIKSSSLRGLNSGLRIYFTNTTRDVATPLGSVGIAVGEEASGDIYTKEKALAAATSERLEDARLNAVFDRTYAREMTYRLANQLLLMKQIYSSTSNQELRSFLKSSYDDLVPIHESFSDFNEASS